MNKKTEFRGVDQAAALKLEDQLIKPIAEKIVEGMPVSALESHDQKYKRACEQLRASYRNYQQFFVEAGKLLNDAGFKWKNADQSILTKLDNLMKHPKEGMQELFERDETIRDVLKFSEEEIEQIYAIAGNCYAQKRYEDARSIFLFLATICPDMAIFYVGLGMTEQQCGHYDTATQFYSIAANLDSEEPSVYLYAAHCLHLQNRTEEGIQVLDALVEALDDDSEWKNLKAQAVELKKSWKR